MMNKLAYDIAFMANVKLAALDAMFEKYAAAGNMQQFLNFFQTQPTKAFTRFISGMQNGTIPYPAAAKLFHNGIMKNPQLATTGRQLNFLPQIQNMLNSTAYQQAAMPNVARAFKPITM